MPRGIFRLKQVYEEQLSGNWSTKGDVWNTPSPFLSSGPAPFGYFAGGMNPSSVYVTTVDRIDYSNDAAKASVRGPLSIARGYVTATGNASFGYFGGGIPFSSKLDRIDYGNDTVTALAKGNLSISVYNASATGNASFGYFGGGAPATKSTVDRIDYSNDTATASPKGLLTVARASLAATGNQSFGYFGGGSTPSPTTGLSTVDRIDYGNDTATASPKGPLSGTRRSFSATGNSSFGYFGGGYVNPGNTSVSTVDRIDYSSDTGTAPAKGPLVNVVNLSAATGNSEFGYFASYQANVNRVDYSNDTATAVAKGPLSVARFYMGATSRKAYGLPYITARGTINHGYFGGGFGPSTSSTVDRIDYTNDTGTAVVKGPLSVARQALAATGNSTHGYFAAGGYSRVDRIDYTNDTPTISQRTQLSITCCC